MEMTFGTGTGRPYVVAKSGEAGEAPVGAVPIDLYGAGGGVVDPAPLSWDDITDVPDSLTKAGAAAAVTVRAIGTTATSAAAGNHDHKVIVHAASGLAAAATIQAAFEAMSTRVKAVTDANTALAARVQTLEDAAAG